MLLMVLKMAEEELTRGKTEVKMVLENQTGVRKMTVVHWLLLLVL